MFLPVNNVRVSLREYLYEGNFLLKPLVLFLAVFVKLFRIPLPGSTDIPAVQTLLPFRASPDQWPAELAESFEVPDADLQRAGFTTAGALSINDTTRSTQYASQLYQSSNGDSIAWLRNRLWPQLERSNRFPRVNLYSRAQNGSVIMTTSANRDLLDPPDWDVEYHTRSSVADLIAAHRLHLTRVLGTQRPMVVGSGEESFDVLEQLHQQFVSFQQQRGVFGEAEPDDVAPVVPLVSADEDAELAELVPGDAEGSAAAGEVTAPTAPDPVAEVIAEVRRLETKQTQWLTKIIVLAVSVAFFVGLGAVQWDLKLVLMLVPILFVHELGHYIAMMAFGYKNVQMFYIPLLGAAVTGRHYQVAGWKKAMVSLAGPLPSIVLGLGLGGVGVFYDSELLKHVCLLTLFLNVFNLLPFLPLDGGWVAHITLFSRSQFLDLAFRIGTLLALLGGSILLGDRFLMYFAIAMSLGLPVVWKTMKATRIAKQQPMPQPTDDQIPEAAIRQIVTAIQAAGVPAQGAKPLAQTTVNVYEAVQMTPPSWPATIGIWTLHLGGVMLALFGGILLSAANFLRDDLFDAPEMEPKYVEVSLADGDFRMGTSPLPDTDLLSWDYEDSVAAEAAFARLSDEGDHSVGRLGTLVFCSQSENERLDEPIPDQEIDWDGFSETEYVHGIERRSRNDVRLSNAPPASWSRSFRFDAWGLPVLVASFADSEQATKIVQDLSNTPEPMGERYPIAPWTPQKEITEQQQELRRLLLTLQGRTEVLPWQADDPIDDLESLTGEAFKEWVKASRERHEKQMELRKEWIANEQASASGTRLQLLQAYTQYEADSEAWSNERLQQRQQQRRQQRDNDADEPDPQVAADQTPPPIVADYLTPILPELGYFDDEDPLRRFAALTHAMEMSAEDFEKMPPLSGSLVRIRLNQTKDPAASIGAVMAWLKKNDTTGLVWSYDEGVLPEDNEKAVDK